MNKAKTLLLTLLLILSTNTFAKAVRGTRANVRQQSTQIQTHVQFTRTVLLDLEVAVYEENLDLIDPSIVERIQELESRLAGIQPKNLVQNDLRDLATVMAQMETLIQNIQHAVRSSVVDFLWALVKFKNCAVKKKNKALVEEHEAILDEIKKEEQRQADLISSTYGSEDSDKKSEITAESEAGIPMLMEKYKNQFSANYRIQSQIQF